MIQKNILIVTIAILAVLSACNQIEEQETKELVRKINARAGELTLKYANGQATLSGMLQRSVPCVDWNVKVIVTKDIPTSQVNINIFDKNEGVICIQIVGEPQEINEVIENVDKNTNYNIKFEDKVVFEGKLQ